MSQIGSLVEVISEAHFIAKPVSDFHIGAGPKNGEKDDTKDAASNDFSNLKKLKKEFDNLDTRTDTSQKDETGMQDASPAADDNNKDKSKGSVDDA